MFGLWLSYLGLPQLKSEKGVLSNFAVTESTRSCQHHLNIDARTVFKQDNLYNKSVATLFILSLTSMSFRWPLPR